MLSVKIAQGIAVVSLSMCLLAVGASGTPTFAASAESGISSSTAAKAQMSDTTAQSQQTASAAPAQVKLTEADAVAATQNGNSGYTFSVDELDTENGTPVYELHGTSVSGRQITVLVNAIDGAASAETEGSDGTEQDGNTPEKDNGRAQDQSALAAQAKVTEAQAIAAAEAANSGYIFTAVCLDTEDETVVYEMKGRAASGSTLELTVSAVTGTVVPETPDD